MLSSKICALLPLGLSSRPISHSRAIVPSRSHPSLDRFTALSRELQFLNLPVALAFTPVQELSRFLFVSSFSSRQVYLRNFALMAFADPSSSSPPHQQARRRSRSSQGFSVVSDSLSMSVFMISSSFVIDSVFLTLYLASASLVGCSKRTAATTTLSRCFFGTRSVQLHRHQTLRSVSPTLATRSSLSLFLRARQTVSAYVRSSFPISPYAENFEEFIWRSTSTSPHSPQPPCGDLIFLFTPVSSRPRSSTSLSELVGCQGLAHLGPCCPLCCHTGTLQCCGCSGSTLPHRPAPPAFCNACVASILVTARSVALGTRGSLGRFSISSYTSFFSSHGFACNLCWFRISRTPAARLVFVFH